ncbi:hypothetical protein N431DRAFT_465844 [Stipitochalara longipes BDJ]|nr:hypothetical protein N431DRAFT_465844 [Stipitochalara longipes BDJ]
MEREFVGMSGADPMNLGGIGSEQGGLSGMHCPGGMGLGEVGRRLGMGGMIEPEGLSAVFIRMEGMENRSEHKFESLDARIRGLEIAASETKNRIEKLEAGVAKLEKDVVGLNGNVARVERGIERAGGDFERLDGDIEDLQERVEEMEGDLMKFERDVKMKKGGEVGKELQSKKTGSDISID